MYSEPFIQKNDSFLELSNWKKLCKNLTVGFTTKNGGNSLPPYESLNLGLHVNDKIENVVSNRKSLAKLIKFDIKNWVCSEQTHDHHIKKITKEHCGTGVFDYNGSIKDTDGLYTEEKNILLTLCFADCVPLYFFAPDKQYIGLAHAGWKGTVKDIAGKMVEQWKKEGISPEEIYAAIGPAIGSCCYIVDNHVINFVDEVIGDSPNYFYTEISNGQYSLDLHSLNEFLFIRAGIPPENIQRTSFCTSCSSDLFFSHRRDKGQTGRMMSFIGFKEEEN